MRRTRRTAFPDLTFAIDEALAEGNKVTVRWTGRGTHKGLLMGIAPAGKASHTHGDRRDSHLQW
jgi:predicted ester cyclase